MALEAAMVVISVISAIIAATSAVMAYRVRIQTRTDIFESHRDTLILAMAENDNRAEYLALHSTLLQEKLSRLLAKRQTEFDEDARGLLANLKEIPGVTKSLSTREYTEKSLEEIKFNEESLLTLRRVARGEQVIAESLQNKCYELVFDEVKTVISKMETKIKNNVS